MTDNTDHPSESSAALVRVGRRPDSRGSARGTPRAPAGGRRPLSRASVLRQELDNLARSDGGLLLDLDCRRGHFIVRTARKFVLLGHIAPASRWAHMTATESEHRASANAAYRLALAQSTRLDLQRRSEFFDADNAQEDARLRRLAAQTAADLLATRHEESLEHIRRACAGPNPVATLATSIDVAAMGEDAPEFREYVADALLSDPAC